MENLTPTNLRVWTGIAFFALTTLAITGILTRRTWRQILAGEPGMSLEAVRAFGPRNGMVLMGAVRGISGGILAGILGFGLPAAIGALLSAGVWPAIITLVGAGLAGGLGGGFLGVLTGVGWGLLMPLSFSRWLVDLTIVLGTATTGALLLVLIVANPVALLIGASLGLASGIGVLWYLRPGQPEGVRR